MGLMQYSQHLFVIWSDYEILLCKLFGCFPCHVSIVKVNDVLLVYAPSTMDIEFSFFGNLTTGFRSSHRGDILCMKIKATISIKFMCLSKYPIDEPEYDGGYL